MIKNPPTKCSIIKDKKGKQYEYWGYDADTDQILVRELRDLKKLAIPRKSTWLELK